MAHRHALGRPSDTSAPIERRDLRRVVASSLVGTTIEWYDFYLYGTAATIVFNKEYFPTTDPTTGTLLAFATFAVGFVARPVGGIVFGHIGDRLGRRTTLITTMTMMGTATFAIGLLPPYASIGVLAPILLVVLRVAQGIALGGEWGGAVLLSVECAPLHRRGLYGSFPQIGLALGLMFGTGILAGLNSTMSDRAFLSWGWRIAFLLSALLVYVGVVTRLRVMETPAFRMLDHRAQRGSIPLLALMRDQRSRRHVLLGIGARLTEGITFNAWAVFVLSYGTATLKLARQPLLVAVMCAAGVMAVFIPVFGRLSDRIGRKTTFCIGAVVSVLLAPPAFAALGGRDPVVFTLALIAVLGVGFPIMYGPQAAFFAELFPTSTRYTGISFVYQFAGIFSSGLSPFVLAYLIAVAHGYSLVLAYFAAAAVVSVACAIAVRPLYRRRFTAAPTGWWYA